MSGIVGAKALLAALKKAAMRSTRPSGRLSAGKGKVGSTLRPELSQRITQEQKAAAAKEKRIDMAAAGMATTAIGLMGTSAWLALGGGESYNEYKKRRSIAKAKKHLAEAERLRDFPAIGWDGLHAGELNEMAKMKRHFDDAYRDPNAPKKHYDVYTELKEREAKRKRERPHAEKNHQKF